MPDGERAPLAAAADKVRRAVSRRLYRKAVMWRYEVHARDSVAPPAACPYPVDVLGPADFSRVAASNPYLHEQDLADLQRQTSVCVVVRDGERIIASCWMTRGAVRVHELERVVDVPAGEHFCCRSYVLPEYRGAALFSHMLHAYAGRLPGDDLLWGLVYGWNVASARSFELAGWGRSRRYWTRVVLTRRSYGCEALPLQGV